MASGPNWIICWLWKFNFRTLSSSNNAREYYLLTLEIETLWSFGHKSPWFQVRVEYGKLMIASYIWSDWSNFGSGAGQMTSCTCFPQRKKSINKYEVKIPESTNQKYLQKRKIDGVYASCIYKTVEITHLFQFVWEMLGYETKVLLSITINLGSPRFSHFVQKLLRTHM